jgi:hypothetical protein
LTPLPWTFALDTCGGKVITSPLGKVEMSP